MITLNTKTFDELQEETLQELNAIGLNNEPGSIARLFLSIINKNIADLYDVLNINHMRAFLSTSSGDALDLIGELLNCQRRFGESDDDYKYRISQQYLVNASSNETSIRLAALSVDGVQDVLLKPHSMGSGTFSVILIIDRTYDADAVIETVKENIDKTVGYGIKYNVVTPTLTYVKFGFKLYMNETISDADAQSIRYDVQSNIADYINSLAVGEDIMIDKITQVIMNTSDKIISNQNTSFYINNIKAIYVNQSCRWFERFALSTDIDNVVIS